MGLTPPHLRHQSLPKDRLHSEFDSGLSSSSDPSFPTLVVSHPDDPSRATPTDPLESHRGPPGLPMTVPFLSRGLLRSPRPAQVRRMSRGCPSLRTGTRRVSLALYLCPLFIGVYSVEFGVKTRTERREDPGVGRTLPGD